MTEAGEFQADLLKQIASSLGLTYEQLSADYYDTHRAVIVARYRAWMRWEKLRQAELNAWINAIAFQVMLEVMLVPYVEGVCGYNPQRLLEYRP